MKIMAYGGIQMAAEAHQDMEIDRDIDVHLPVGPAAPALYAVTLKVVFSFNVRHKDEHSRATPPERVCRASRSTATRLLFQTDALARRQKYCKERSDPKR